MRSARPRSRTSGRHEDPGHAGHRPEERRHGVRDSEVGEAGPFEVAHLIARGLTNRQLAEALIVTEGSAANYVQRVLNKLGFNTRAQIAAWAVEHGLGPSPSR